LSGKSSGNPNLNKSNPNWPKNNSDSNRKCPSILSIREQILLKLMLSSRGRRRGLWKNWRKVWAISGRWLLRSLKGLKTI